MCTYIIEAGHALGRDINVHRYGSLMEKVGFVDVAAQDAKWPTNTWAAGKKYKEMGACSLFALDKGLEGIVMALYTRGLGWSMDETLEFCNKVRKELRNPRIHAYWPMYDLCLTRHDTFADHLADASHTGGSPIRLVVVK